MSAKKKRKKQRQVREKEVAKPFRKTSGYRFLVITILFLVLGTAAFSWLVASNAVRGWVIWVMGGFFLLAYLITLLLAEAMALEKEGNLNKEYLKGRWVAFWKAFVSIFKG